ncbi:AfsR/SARP family transcriptional regulator [Nocardia sp. CDC153]|uniref:AfsR/SARP family transcriptional regulator n=1 Tax=Nocardia sp. CDC153 TaxID=3112167 RepID=UPI002DBFFA91|nr:AfsR/SARP family transcriptional regulator [Nocardia sp. CDC153]MEC3956971.1 AfsR/SARP family transcriptional regulator [Nocardia sp. CDC153]
MTMEGSTTLFFRALGPTRVELGDTAVHIGGPVPRRMLTALLAADGHQVSDGALVQQIWDAPPGRVIETLRVVACRLRTALGRDARNPLRRSEFGYTLVLEAGATDIELFRDRVARGLALSRLGRAAEAVATFDAALDLWHGQPWADLGDSIEMTAARQGLLDLYDAAVEERIAACLADGDTIAPLAALRTALAAGPYRERRWELLALALYRCGRQVHALTELRRARELFVREIGIEPGPALRDLEHRILTHDPHLLVAGTRELVGGRF